MTVKTIMNDRPITTVAEASVIDVQKTLKENKIHRLPVVDNKGTLIGIITEKNILYATPSPASSLSIYEIPALFAKLKVKNLMKKPRCITEDTTVEDAAKIMIDDDLSCLPVVDANDKLLGIVSKSDMFKLLSELFGSSEKGLRVTFSINEGKGQIAKITNALVLAGYDMISIGTFVDKKKRDSILTTLKLRADEKDKVQILEIIKPLVKEILDIRVI